MGNKLEEFEKFLLFKIKNKNKMTRGKTLRQEPEPDKLRAMDVCRAGKDRAHDRALAPVDRESIRVQLNQHFGTSKVEKYLLSCKNIKEVSDRLETMRDKMLDQIEVEEKAAEKYFDEIQMEYKKTGRPKSVFNWIEFDYLCSIQCTLNELAGFFGMSKDTVQLRIKEEWGITFSAYYEQKSQGVKVGLRRAQIRNALDGDTNMQKFLGINMLGQKNKLEFEGEIKVNSFVDLMKNLENRVNGDESEDE